MTKIIIFKIIAVILSIGFTYGGFVLICLEPNIFEWIHVVRGLFVIISIIISCCSVYTINSNLERRKTDRFIKNKLYNWLEEVD